MKYQGYSLVLPNWLIYFRPFFIKVINSFPSKKANNCRAAGLSGKCLNMNTFREQPQRNNQEYNIPKPIIQYNQPGEVSCYVNLRKGFSPAFQRAQ